MSDHRRTAYFLLQSLVEETGWTFFMTPHYLFNFLKFSIEWGGGECVYMRVHVCIYVSRYICALHLCTLPCRTFERLQLERLTKGQPKYSEVPESECGCGGGVTADLGWWLHNPSVLSINKILDCSFHIPHPKPLLSCCYCGTSSSLSSLPCFGLLNLHVFQVDQSFLLEETNSAPLTTDWTAPARTCPKTS